MRALVPRRPPWIARCAEHLKDWLEETAVRYQSSRWFAKKIRRKKGPVEPLNNTPNSVAALMSDRPIPDDMDVRDVWDRTTYKKERQLERLANIESRTRFTGEGSVDGVGDGAMENDLISSSASPGLEATDVCRYYNLEKGYIQEAFREFYKFTSEDGKHDLPKRGCRALYKEVQMTGLTSVLNRECMHKLRERLTDEKPKRIWLDGKSGSGKSIALVSLVEWARQNSWLVLYLPSALSLVSDYFYARRNGDSEMYDTIVVAKEILKSVYAVYGGQSGSLSTLSRTQTETTERDLGQTLEDVCRIGMSSGDPAVVCDAVTQLLREFLYGDHGVEKLVAVDDYNALYWKTQYYQWKTERHRVMIPAENVTLATAFRVLTESDAALQSHVVASSTGSGGIPQRIWIPNADRVKSFPIPPFTEDEMACVLCYYWQQQAIHAVHPHSVKRLFFVTGGNMHDFKRALSTL